MARNVWPSEAGNTPKPVIDDLIIPQGYQPQSVKVRIDGTTGFCIFCGRTTGELYWSGRYMAHVQCSKDAKAAAKRDIPFEEYTGNTKANLRDYIPGPEKVLMIREMARRHAKKAQRRTK